MMWIIYLGSVVGSLHCLFASLCYVFIPLALGIILLVKEDPPCGVDKVSFHNSCCKYIKICIIGWFASFALSTFIPDSRTYYLMVASDIVEKDYQKDDSLSKKFVQALSVKLDDIIADAKEKKK